MRRTSLLLASMTLVAPVGSAAQDTVPITPGARVRVSAPDLLGPRRLVASLVAVRRDTLVLHPTDAGSSTRAVPFGQIERLEASQGRRGRVLIGAGIGAAVGALVMVDIFGVGGDEGASLSDIAVGGLLGGLAGAAVGAAFSGERWQRVPLPGRANLGLRLLRRPGVALSLSF